MSNYPDPITDVGAIAQKLVDLQRQVDELSRGPRASVISLIADGSITNPKLANSTISVNGNSVALGGSTSISASQLNAGNLPVAQGGSGGTTGAGLVPVIPTSVAVGSGSASVSASGLITVTNASSFTINGAFTSTYKYFRVMMEYTGKSGNSSMRWTTNGTAITSAVYYNSIYVFRSAGTSGVYASGPTSSVYDFAYGVDTNINVFSMDVYNPAIATRTQTQYQQMGPGMEARVGASEYSYSDIVDGFQVFPLNGTGTYTASIRIYGYRN